MSKSIFIVLLLFILIFPLVAQDTTQDNQAGLTKAQRSEIPTDDSNFIKKIAESKVMNDIFDFFVDLVKLIKEFIRSNPFLVKMILLYLCFALLLIMFILNFMGRLKLEKGLEKEYGKLDARVAQRTKKIHLTNKSLQQDLDSKERKEKELLRVKEAVETMLIGVTITDIFGKILFVNPADAEMHGYKPDELIGKYISVFTDDVLRSELDMDNIEEWHGIIRNSNNVRKDGSVFSVQMISNVIKDEVENPIAIVTTFEDVTERAKAEQALKDSEESFRRIFENIQDIYYEVDIDGIIKEVSPSIKMITNQEPKDLIGKPMVHLYSSPAERENMLKALKREDTITDYEVSMKGQDEGDIPCSVTAKLMLDENMLPSRIVGSMRNITRRKIAEEAQKHILEDLQYANKDLRDFAYITSHDLKSPLRAISTLATWINKDYSDKFDENGKEQMNLLIGRVDRMNQLIEGLFQYSSLGSFKTDPVTIDTKELIQKVIGKINPAAGIKLNISDQIPAVVFEKNRMEQIFFNLLHNSVTYMGGDEGEIKVDYKLVDKFHQFRVTDTGIGISDRYFDKIFQIFQTLQSRDDLETAGIGLALVKKIVEMNGGKIWVESELNKGSSFSFTLPNREAK